MKFKFEKSFSAAHFYKQALWDDQKNQEEFGKCFTDFGHGHDYRLEIGFESETAESTVKAIESLIEKLDHQHLNFTVEEFKNKIPTTENIALYIQRELRRLLQAEQVPSRVFSLKLQETPEIWVELFD